MTHPTTEPMHRRPTSPNPSRRTSRTAALAMVLAVAGLAPACASGPPVEAGASAALADGAKDPDGAWRTSTTPPPGPTVTDFPGCAESARYTLGTGAISLATDDNRDAAFDALQELADQFGDAAPELAEYIDADMLYLRRLSEEADTITAGEQRSAQANTFVITSWWQENCIQEPEAADDPATTAAPKGTVLPR